MKNRPAYALSSVDNALQLIQMLRDQGKLRLSEAADELGVGRSTAHRLLSTLVYRGFAEQDDQHGYLPGASLAPAAPQGGELQQLRKIAYSSMDRLCERVRETVNLMVRVGTQTRFLASVESPQVLHVGDRRGTILPAAKTSGGKALLAELTTTELAALYGHSGESGEDWQRLCRDLELVRGRGYATNEEETEAGVFAVGMAMHDADDVGVAALTIAVPSARSSRQRLAAFVPDLRIAIEEAERELRRAT
ncbi:MAG: helix-turn-helix domain-containing protein [Actinophytocola sp.]|nr:helix-turn-helix domain-containing protein [Actinophytocola sp.]